ncbi:MAG: hypothetical protein OEZ06_05925 [Myxococcales bacterium]|nr:hypothetical protein [Myxococcales bacterium]
MTDRNSNRPSAAPPGRRASVPPRESAAGARNEEEAIDDPLDPDPRRETRRRSHDDYDPRPGLDRILAELLRRGVEAGRGPLEKVGESFFPRDMAHNVVSQLGDLRSGVVKAVAQEVGHFLREADIASEMRKVLLGLDVQAEFRLRFHERPDGSLDTEIKVDRVKTGGDSGK